MGGLGEARTGWGTQGRPGRDGGHMGGKDGMGDPWGGQDWVGDPQRGQDEGPQARGHWGLSSWDSQLCRPGGLLPHCAFYR